MSMKRRMILEREMKNLYNSLENCKGFQRQILYSKISDIKIILRKG